MKHRSLPTIAVVVPILNEADGLPTLISMLRSADVNEMVFVDGGSSDRTIEVLKKTSVTWLASERGRGRQMNAGAKKISSDIILFLHADTKIDHYHTLAIQKGCAVYFVIGGRFDVILSGSSVAFRVIEWMINLRSRFTKISTGDQAMFVRRDVFESMGGFADIPLMEDVEFSKRLKTMGEVACLREKVTTSSRRWEKYGIVSTVLLMWKLRFLFFLGVDPVKLKQRYVNHQSVDQH